MATMAVSPGGCSEVLRELSHSDGAFAGHGQRHWQNPFSAEIFEEGKTRPLLVRFKSNPSVGFLIHRAKLTPC